MTGGESPQLSQAGGYRLAALRQLATFAFVSIATTVIDFALFNVLLRGGSAAATANSISYSAGILASYVLNKRLTFPGGGRRHRSFEVGIFVLVNLGGLALSTVAVGLAEEAGTSTVALNVVKLIAGVATWVLKFVAFKRWVYPIAPSGPAEGTGNP